MKMINLMRFLEEVMNGVSIDLHRIVNHQENKQICKNKEKIYLFVDVK